MPEVVNQVAFDVIGADVTISMASEHVPTSIKCV